MIGVKYFSWGDDTGYAAIGMACATHLHHAGVRLTWTPMLPKWRRGYQPISARGHGPPPLNQLCNIEIPFDRVMAHTTPEQYEKILAAERTAGRQIIGSTMWETNRLPQHWPEIINRLDRVVVPSGWNQQLFQQQGVRVPIAVVPLYSEFEGRPSETPAELLALERMRARIGAGEGRHIFYTISMWTPRKGVELLLDAYWRAFHADDPVLLVIKTSRYDMTTRRRRWQRGFRLLAPPAQESLQRLTAGRGRLAPVLLITESLDPAAIRALHTLGDSYISLSRGEGWGLGAYEAAWYGKPVIATDHAGHREFLDSQHAWLIPGSAASVTTVPGWSEYSADQQWIEPSVEAAAEAMRAIVADPAAAQARAQAQQAQVSQRFTAEAITAALINALEG